MSGRRNPKKNPPAARSPSPQLEADLFGKLLDRLASRIVSERAKRKFSQAELARRSGISITRLNEIETRRNQDVRLSTLHSLALALSCTVYELLLPSDLNISSEDRSELLQASESILRITKKL